MQAEIVMIGTELLLGQITDTNAVFMAKTLAENGINLYQKTTVGDNRERIVRVLDEALSRADVVLTSGGLGPTADDITRECVAELCGRPLEFRQELFDQLAGRFVRLRRPMSENNKKQAYAPRGAIAIANPNGTAPGLIVEDARGVIICMPGVPHELQPMLTDSVIPYLRRRFGLTGVLHYRVLKLCGIGESAVDAAIADLVDTQENPTVGLLASPDAVRVRIAAHADTREEADALIDQTDAEVRRRLPGLVMGVDDDTLEGMVDDLLTERGWKLAVSETWTGGMICRRLTTAGARSFVGGTVLPGSVLPAQNPRQAATALAEKTQAQWQSDCALSTVAVPGAGYGIAVFLSPNGVQEWEISFARTDELSQLRSTVTCLEHIRRQLAGVVVP